MEICMNDLEADIILEPDKLTPFQWAKAFKDTTLETWYRNTARIMLKSYRNLFQIKKGETFNITKNNEFYSEGKCLGTLEEKLSGKPTPVEIAEHKVEETEKKRAKIEKIKVERAEKRKRGLFYNLAESFKALSRPVKYAISASSIFLVLACSLATTKSFTMNDAAKFYSTETKADNVVVMGGQQEEVKAKVEAQFTINLPVGDYGKGRYSFQNAIYSVINKSTYGDKLRERYIRNNLWDVAGDIEEQLKNSFGDELDSETIYVLKYHKKSLTLDSLHNEMKEDLESIFKKISRRTDDKQTLNRVKYALNTFYNFAPELCQQLEKDKSRLEELGVTLEDALLMNTTRIAIESGGKVSALSRQGASSLNQLMPGLLSQYPAVFTNDPGDEVKEVFVDELQRIRRKYERVDSSWSELDWDGLNYEFSDFKTRATNKLGLTEEQVDNYLPRLAAIYILTEEVRNARKSCPASDWHRFNMGPKTFKKAMARIAYQLDKDPEKIDEWLPEILPTFDVEKNMEVGSEHFYNSFSEILEERLARDNYMDSEFEAFKDTFAAYNAGSGKFMRLFNKYGGVSYLMNYHPEKLKKETRNYVSAAEEVFKALEPFKNDIYRAVNDLHYDSFNHGIGSYSEQRKTAISFISDGILEQHELVQKKRREVRRMIAAAEEIELDQNM